MRTVTPEGAVAPALTPVDHPAMGALYRAIERVWGKNYSADELATVREVKIAALIAFSVAGLAGLALAARVTWWFIPLGIVCGIAGWAYTTSHAALTVAPQLLLPSSSCLVAAGKLVPMPLSVSAACPEQSTVQSGAPITRSSVFIV